MKMNNFNPVQFAINALNQNPNLKNNPRAQGLMEIIQSGDAIKGEQMAKNLCQTYGVSVDEGLKQAKTFFHIPM